jgi:flagellar protein FliS
MVYGDACKTYQRVNIETADTLKLIIMCYEAAIKDLGLAREYHEAGRMDDAYGRIRHAQDLVTELLLSLDYERGGEISTNLSKIYNFVLRQLIGINSRRDTTIYGHLINILSELKDAWEQVRQTTSGALMRGTAQVGRGWEMRA